MTRFVGVASCWTFWPSLGSTLGLLAIGKPLLWLFGPEFTVGYSAMFILAAGYILRATMGPAEFVLKLLSEQNRAASVLFVAAVVNLALDFALIPKFGMHGAAAATIAFMWLSSIAMFVIARRRLGLNIFFSRSK